MSTVFFVKDTGNDKNGIPFGKILVGKHLIKILLLKLMKYYLQWREDITVVESGILFKDGVLKKNHSHENLLLLFM